jgi:UrcA family protein
MSALHCVRTGALIGVMAGGLLVSGAAFAQKPPPFIELDSVTVTSPKTIERNRDGVISQVVSMSVRVPYFDLDMRTAQGVAELNKRVGQAADYVCETLAFRYPTGDPEPFYCAKQAVGDAKPQLVLAASRR